MVSLLPIQTKTISVPVEQEADNNWVLCNHSAHSTAEKEAGAETETKLKRKCRNRNQKLDRKTTRTITKSRK